MLFSPRYSTRESAQLCQRLSIAVESGIDVRKIWADEANRARGRAKSRFQRISSAINQGDSLAKGMAATDDYFPLLFRELTAVGEETGRIDAVYRQLADHFNQRLQMRRYFLAAIAWPVTLVMQKFMPAALSATVVSIALAVSLVTGVVSGFLRPGFAGMGRGPRPEGHTPHAAARRLTPEARRLESPRAA